RWTPCGSCGGSVATVRGVGRGRMSMASNYNESRPWALATLQPPYVNIIVIERYVCRDSVVVVFTAENRFRWAVLTPFN
ncbi:MAG: hypothetical protein ACREBG_21410, partial [Pyrinomonadaceae bacterium]